MFALKALNCVLFEKSFKIKFGYYQTAHVYNTKKGKKSSKATLKYPMTKFPELYMPGIAPSLCYSFDS